MFSDRTDPNPWPPQNLWSYKTATFCTFYCDFFKIVSEIVDIGWRGQKWQWEWWGTLLPSPDQRNQMAGYQPLTDTLHIDQDDDVEEDGDENQDDAGERPFTHCVKNDPFWVWTVSLIN